MERSEQISLVGAFLLMLSATACDKTEQAAKKFTRENRWAVTEISIDSDPIDKLPTWEISDCGDYSTFCTANWLHPFGTTTNFYWRFSNIGGTFEFYPDSSVQQTGNMAYAQCENFSGEYKVMKSKRKTFHFESEQTKGYPGKMVTIFLEAQE